MALKERKARRRWWRQRKTQQRLAVAALLLGAVGVLAWFVMQGEGDSEPVYLTEPAPLFTLPTVAGDEFSLVEHRGQHNVLLYFNEGLG